MTSDRKSSSLATVSSSNPIAGISAANMATSALLEGLSNVSHSWYLLNGVLACLASQTRVWTVYCFASTNASAVLASLLNYI